MSSTEVDYPDEIKQYQVFITSDLARITLEGIEGAKLLFLQGDGTLSTSLEPVGETKLLIETGR